MGSAQLSCSLHSQTDSTSPEAGQHCTGILGASQRGKRGSTSHQKSRVWTSLLVLPQAISKPHRWCAKAADRWKLRPSKKKKKTMAYLHTQSMQEVPSLGTFIPERLASYCWPKQCLHAWAGRSRLVRALCVHPGRLPELHAAQAVQHAGVAYWRLHGSQPYTASVTASCVRLAKHWACGSMQTALAGILLLHAAACLRCSAACL